MARGGFFLSFVELLCLGRPSRYPRCTSGTRQARSSRHRPQILPTGLPHTPPSRFSHPEARVTNDDIPVPDPFRQSDRPPTAHTSVLPKVMRKLPSSSSSNDNNLTGFHASTSPASIERRCHVSMAGNMVNFAVCGQCPTTSMLDHAPTRLRKEERRQIMSWPTC